jgi:diacylglycerol kinase family enzyme
MDPSAVGDSTRHVSAETVSPTQEGRSWIGIVANRNSGIGRGRHLVAKLVLALRRVGLGVDIAWTTEDRTALVSRSAADPKCRCLIAVGGDGTVSALLNERPKVPVSVFPAGTENLVARQFGLRRNPFALARTITDELPRRVDVGSAQGRRFLLMVGFGFDGDIVTRHHQTRLSRLGMIRPTTRLAYVLPVLRSSLRYRFPIISVRIENDGVPEILTGTTVFVFNAPRYALGLPFVPAARDDDGWLDLLVFRDPGPFKALYYLWHVLRGTHLDLPSVFHRRVRMVHVTAQATVPVQIDGDPGGFLLPGGDSASPASSAPTSHGEHASGGGSAPDSAPIWTVQIIPQALEVFAPARPRSPSRQASLASDGAVR